MLRMNVFAAALLVGWGLSQVAFAEEKPAYRGALPPSVADTLRDTKIETILRQPCALDIDESSLQDAVDHLRQKFDIEVKLDQKALADAAIDASVLLTFHVKDVPLASALDLMLEDLELTFIIQHGVLKITSKEKADGIVTVRVYPIADLTNVAQAAPGARQRSNVGALIQLIEDAIAPDSWDTNSGIGSIKPFRTPGGLTLVISNTRPVQIQVATMLADLRAIKQPAAEAEAQAADPKTPYRAMYDLGAVSGPAMVKAITAAVSPGTWEGKGGAGVVRAVPVSIMEDVTPDEAKKEVAPKSGAIGVIQPPRPQRPVATHWKLVVVQTDDVHQQIEDLLAPLSSEVHRIGRGSGLGGFMRVSR